MKANKFTDLMELLRLSRKVDQTGAMSDECDWQNLALKRRREIAKLIHREVIRLKRSAPLAALRRK